MIRKAWLEDVDILVVHHQKMFSEKAGSNGDGKMQNDGNKKGGFGHQ